MQKFSYVGKYSGGGSTNSFYKIKGKRYGFKGFPNRSLADFAHKAQSILAAENLAPRVYSVVCKIRVPNYFAESDGKGGIRAINHMVLSDWGYLTEIAQVYECYSDDCCGDCAEDNCCDNYGTIQDLLNNIEGCGLDYGDAHSNNFGYVKRGKNKVLVAIDLGAESVTTDDNSYPEVCWDGTDNGYCNCEQCRQSYYDSENEEEYDYA